MKIKEEKNSEFIFRKREFLDNFLLFLQQFSTSVCEEKKVMDFPFLTNGRGRTCSMKEAKAKKWSKKKVLKIWSIFFFFYQKNLEKKPLNALLGRCCVSGRVQVQPCLPSWTSKGHVSWWPPAVHSVGTSCWCYTTKMYVSQRSGWCWARHRDAPLKILRL